MPEDTFKYSVDVGLDIRISDSEKNKIMSEVSKMLEDILGKKAYSGTCIIYTPKQETPKQGQ